MTERYLSISTAVDAERDLILEAERCLRRMPQTGFREWAAHNYLAGQFQQLGYTLTAAGDIPGFFTDLDTGRPGPRVLVLGELDALICPSHPEADPETGVAHCCGHHAQCAALLGLAAALRAPEVTKNLCGTVRLCAVPAEELIELDYRAELIGRGVIRFPGGKAEFLARGYFDGVDMAILVHTSQSPCFAATAGAVGCVTKQITYHGVSAHAGAAPWEGCNALYAATLGLQAINALRETFREQELIRVHPILTQGGDAVNAIPHRAVLETFVRGSDFDTILRANRRIDRALCGAALSLGADVEISDLPGYAPLRNAESMIRLAEEAAAAVAPEISFAAQGEITTGSTDMGDLSCLMPVIHPYVPGAAGTSHGADYRIADPELACVLSAKWQLAMLTLLLAQDAARAREIIADYAPQFPSKEAYLRFMDGLTASGRRITYTENGASVRL